MSSTSALFHPFVLLFCYIFFLFLCLSLLYPGKSYYWPTHKRFPLVSVFPRANIQFANKFLRCAACYLCSPLSLTLNFQALLNFVIKQSSEDKTHPFPLQDTQTLVPTALSSLPPNALLFLRPTFFCRTNGHCWRTCRAIPFFVFLRNKFNVLLFLLHDSSLENFMSGERNMSSRPQAPSCLSADVSTETYF